MYSTAILIAETDSATLDSLPRLLSERIPLINVVLCTSVDVALQKLQHDKYGAVIGSAALVCAQDNLMLNKKVSLQPLVPLVVTVDRSEAELAKDLLQRGAFDLIRKPIHGGEAIKTVKLALWQSRLLQLLTARDKAVSLFQEHMDAYPDKKPNELFAAALFAVEKTLNAVETSIERIKKVDDGLLYQIAVAVEQQAKDRAMDRLFQLYTEGPTH